MLNTPVAFFIFNRPHLTSIVFDAIAQAKPKKLLVVADGPRFPEEAEKSRQSRAVIERVGWACEVLTNFSEINLGCKHRVSSGLDWVFSEVEEAIILEDDCLPSPSFFYFCETLLEYYRDDERIMHISGNNFQDKQSINNYSYYFSKYSHAWGWASWRRAWKHFSLNMETWLEFKEAGLMKFICEEQNEEKFWTAIFDRMFFEKPSDIWDYMWVYACWCQNGLAILPGSNLVSNIGFGADGTHTSNSENPLSKLPLTDIWEIKHPQLVVRHREADNYTFNSVLSPRNMKNINLASVNIKKIYTELSNMVKF